MKLYYSKGACSLAVRIILEELQVPYESEAVNLKTKQTVSGGDFTKINPKGAVPTLLTEDKQILTENAVIQQYLADTTKGQTLLPPVGHLERYRVLEWLNFISTDLHKGCSPFFNPAMPQEVKDTIAKPALITKLNFVNDALKHNNFLHGNVFSLPDAYLYVILNWFPAIHFDLNDFSELKRYYAALNTRDSVKRARDKEGLSIL